VRADKFLAAHGYYESRAKARAAIDAELVSADGVAVLKPSQILSIDMMIEASSPHPWVSRAGVKLAYALDVFNVNPKGLTCLDVGSSTGGFTDVLLAGGAAKVYAVDVGTDQLHERIRSHKNVVSMEQTDSRNLTAADFESPPSIIVCDVSFISCTKALDVPLRLAANSAQLITLVKPQFEVGRDGVGKGGIVRDQALAKDAVVRVKKWLSTQGWHVQGQDISPIKGGSGNAEYLLYARRN